jgi:aspartate carbamoyltransferase catalytic subunit
VVQCGQYVTRAKRKNGCEFFPSTREYAQQYGVDKTILDSSKEIVIMHPGPINRGVEITSEVADSNQSVILNQENGVAIRMAVIYLLASKFNSLR